jgi:signal peptidase II
MSITTLPAKSPREIPAMTAANPYDAPQTAAKSAANGRLWVYVALFLFLAVGGCALDLWTKTWIFKLLGMPNTNHPWVLWDGVFSLTTSLNEGALFSIGQGFALGFAVLSIGAALGITYWLAFKGAIREPILVVALGLIMAGIGGNLYDRLGWHGLTWHMPVERIGQPVYAVRDWLHFCLIGKDGQVIFNWPVFNLADCYLVVGAGLLFLQSLRNPPTEAAKNV